MKKTKVLLVNPFLTVYSDDPASANPMLSLAYLGAYLLKAGFEVKILDIAAEGAGQVKQIGSKLRCGLDEKEIKSYLERNTPDIVGITCPSTLHAADAHEVARIIREVDSKIPVIFGGAHASSVPRSVLQDKNVDIVVKGEGEETLLEIVKNFQQNKDVEHILGTCIRKGDQITENPPRPYIENLDSIPFPARHLLPMDTYFRLYREQSNYMMRQRAATIITSRGCPGNCIFCAVKTVWGRRWRARSPQNVVDEIEELVKNYHIEEIHFLDDSISVNRKRLMEICEEIIKRKLNIKWTTPNGIAVWLLHKELLRKMKQAGCYRLTFGLESGNRETLNFLGKNYNYDYAREIIKYAHHIGLWTIGTFIIGFPYEKLDSIEDTINFAIDSYLDFAIFYIANPFPGTEMYNIFKKEGLLPLSDSLIVRGCNTKYFTLEELQILQGKATAKFIKSRLYRPWRILTKVRSPEDIKYVFKLAKNLSKIALSAQRVKKKGIAAFWK